MPRYFPHVDGLRALAVLAVMAYHIHPALLPGGFAGVDVFFVISGFVVTASLAEHRGESMSAFLGRFYARRLARIAPALLVMLMATTVAYVLLVPRAWLSGLTESVGRAAFWGLSNWVLGTQSETYFAPRADFNPYLHTWTLGVEEQFYLVAPLLLYGWVRLRGGSGRRNVAVTAMVALALASLAACFLAATRHGAEFVFYALIFRFWELAAGVLWFQWAARPREPSPRFSAYLSWGAWPAIALTAVTLVFSRAETFPWPGALGAVAGALLLIGDPRARPDDHVRRLFARPIMVWIGQRSYSLYLWHWPVFVLFRWTVGLETWPTRFAASTLAVLLALGSYRWIERPVRQSARLKRLPAGLRVTAFLVVIGICWSGARWLLDEQPELGLSQVTRDARDWYATRRMERGERTARRCEPRIVERSLAGGGDITEYRPEGCEVGRGAQLFVLGDSHARAYLPMFDQLSAEGGRMVRVYEMPGCSYISLMGPMADPPPGCLSGARAAVNEVLELAHPGDIVFLPSLRVPRLVNQWGPVRMDEGENEFRRSPGETPSIMAAIEDAPQWFVPFQRAGLQVLFEAPKPIFRVPVFRCVDPYTRVNPQCARGTSESRADEETYRAPALDAMKRLASRYPPIRIWDPLPVLCGTIRCEALTAKGPLYFDADHLSAFGNVVLYPSFRQAVDSIAYP
ncbi:MAG TPA: acyltransferase family protein [Casimicrobiaceae bacterium]|nr:acyltransferase family protein [Casimicrobiaceae bacterium]